MSPGIDIPRWHPVYFSIGCQVYGAMGTFGPEDA